MTISQFRPLWIRNVPTVADGCQKPTQTRVIETRRGFVRPFFRALSKSADRMATESEARFHKWAGYLPANATDLSSDLIGIAFEAASEFGVPAEIGLGPLMNSMQRATTTLSQMLSSRGSVRTETKRGKHETL
jgi:hypothetical protein